MISEEEEEEVTAAWRVQLWHHSVPLALLAMISPLLIDRTQNPRTLHNLLTPSYYNYCYYILINFSFHILLASFTLRLKALFIFSHTSCFFFFYESSFDFLHSCILLYRDASLRSDIVNHWRICGFLFICVCNLFIYTTLFYLACFLNY